MPPLIKNETRALRAKKLFHFFLLFNYDFISLKFINKAVGGSITDPSYICSQNICNNNVSDVKNQRNTRDNRIVCQT